MIRRPVLSLARRALITREIERRAGRNMGPKARLALVAILLSCGVRVSLVQVHRWSRPMQARAYLWARSFLAGQEDLPLPEFIREASRAELAATAATAAATLARKVSRS